MAIKKKRYNRVSTDTEKVSFEITNEDVGNQIDFAKILADFRVIDVNVTVDEAFANANNTVKVGIDGALDRFIPSTAMDSIKGIGFSHIQHTASKPTPIYVTVDGDASASGKATITILYSLSQSTKQEY